MQGKLKILKLIDSGQYKDKDIITKLRTKDLTTLEIKSTLLELKKFGEIYETKEGYLKIVKSTSK